MTADNAHGSLIGSAAAGKDGCITGFERRFHLILMNLVCRRLPDIRTASARGIGRSDSQSWKQVSKMFFDTTGRSSTRSASGTVRRGSQAFTSTVVVRISRLKRKSRSSAGSVSMASVYFVDPDCEGVFRESCEKSVRNTADQRMGVIRQVDTASV